MGKDKERGGYSQFGFDMFTAYFFAIFTLFILIVPFISDPKTKEGEDKPQNPVLEIKLYWPGGKECDIDLWARVPGDQPVGYSNKASHVAHLNQDQLARLPANSIFYEEVVEVDFHIPGEYVANAHLFNIKDCAGPIPVQLDVYARPEPGAKSKKLFSRTGELIFEGHELTLARWQMKGGEMVPDSINAIQEKLRTQPYGGRF